MSASTQIEEVEYPKSFETGQARFVDDLHLEGMLHLKIVRSAYARARLVKVEGKDAITGKEFKANLSAVGEGAWGGPVPIPYPALASEYVSYVGQPLAAVLGKDQYSAEDLIESVQVDYEPLKPLIDPEDAFGFEPIHPGMKSNIATRIELGQDFESKAPIVLEEELANRRISPNPMEPRGLVAHYDGSKLTVWASTQSVHTWKEGLLGVTKLPRDSFRVIQMDTGGAFGTKSGLYPEYAIACYASMKTKRPVKWIETRSEDLVATSQGRGARGRIKVYANREGHVSGVKADILVDNGAFIAGLGAFAPRWIGMQITGPYMISNVYVSGAAVLTNKVPLGPYRGAGRPEAAFLYERMMDLVADELNIDPVEVRLRNISSKSTTSPLGIKLEAYEPFLRSAVKELRYYERKTKAGKSKGIGFSCFILLSAVQPGESSRIMISEGKVKVWMGTINGGQDHAVIAQTVVGEELGIPSYLITLQRGDTSQLDQGVGTWGSRSALIGGVALAEACAKLKEKAKEELGPDFTPEDLLKHNFDVTVFHRNNDSVITFGTNLAEATVDRETGMARISECVAYYDCGRVLNPYMAESQTIGGTAQAIGQVLYEEAKYSKEDGQIITGTIDDAGVPSASLIPNVQVMLADHPSSERVKGVGEGSATGMPPALVRALENAIGKGFGTTPLRPEEIFKKINSM